MLILNYKRTSGTHPRVKCDRTVSSNTDSYQKPFHKEIKKKSREYFYTFISNIFAVLMCKQYSPYILCRPLFRRTHNIYTHVNGMSVCAVSCVWASERQEVNCGTSIRAAGCHGNTKYWISMDRIKI